MATAKVRHWNGYIISLRPSNMPHTVVHLCLSSYVQQWINTLVTNCTSRGYVYFRLGQAPESYVWSKGTAATSASDRPHCIPTCQHCVRTVVLTWILYKESLSLLGSLLGYFFSLKSKREFRKKPVKFTSLLCGFLLLHICQEVHYYTECLFCRVPEHGSCQRYLGGCRLSER
jgi:hypothetical protein